MRTFLLVITILLTSACGNQVIRADKQDYLGLQQAQNYYAFQDYQNAADAYSALYQQYHEKEFAIFAADSYFQLGQYQPAQQLINSIGYSDNPLFLILRAELQLQLGDDNIVLDEVNGKLRVRYLRLKAKIAQRNGNYLEAALALIELSELDPLAVNSSEIISNLSHVSSTLLNQTLYETQLSSMQQGWIEAAIAVSSNDKSLIENWKNNWQEHPANAFFMLENPYSNIAVLLPLSGKYKDISKSVQQGMIAALYQNEDSQQVLNFFDTGSAGENFISAWYGAIESGAEFIIGPLEKRSIHQVQSLSSTSVPILLLNQLHTDDNPFGFYQFPLSVEDEVINVVKRLMAENKKRIMLLAPESQSGRKLAQLFENELITSGGELVSHAFYPESTHDYSREIKQSLGLNDSIVRARTLKSIIAKDIEYESQIRPDIDAIFILSKPNQARLLKPQLKFFKAENLPVYSTSQILSNKPDAALDKDLNGIKFCQSAFIIDSASKQNVLNFNASAIDGYRKFFALGFDAIKLYAKLEWMQTLQNQSIEGLSGLLSVDGNGKVHRELAWAQFKRGIPVLLPPLPNNEIPETLNSLPQ